MNEFWNKSDVITLSKTVSSKIIFFSLSEQILNFFKYPSN